MTRRPLDPDEDALWRRATKDVSPLAGRDKAAAPAPAPRKSGKRALLQSAGRIAVGDGERGAQGLAAQKSANAKSVIGGGDPAADKRAARRRVEIARTLDLHGDTVAAGRNRLLRFLRAARMEGAVCVLVITGKGGAASAAAMTRTRLGAGERRCLLGETARRLATGLSGMGRRAGHSADDCARLQSAAGGWR